VGNRSGGNPRSAGWPYVVTGVVFAGVLGWISYTDALFVTRLAGNDGGIAYAYPTVPDGLLFFSLLALTEAARAGARRPGWATAGLVLGAGMTLAANAGAGLGHSILDAVIDGLVPVCFFIAVEIVLWHIRRGRGTGAQGRSPAAFTDAQTAALEALHRTTAAGNPLTPNQLKTRFRLTRTEVTKVCQLVPQERSRGGQLHHATAPAVTGVPAGESPRSLAGASPNGQAHG